MESFRYGIAVVAGLMTAACFIWLLIEASQEYKKQTSSGRIPLALALGTACAATAAGAILIPQGNPTKAAGATGVILAGWTISAALTVRKGRPSVQDWTATGIWAGAAIAGFAIWTSMKGNLLGTTGATWASMMLLIALHASSTRNRAKSGFPGPAHRGLWIPGTTMAGVDLATLLSLGIATLV